MSRTNNKRKIIVLGIICLIIILIVLLIMTKKMINQKNSENNQPISTIHYYDDKINFLNTISDVYKGDVPTYKISYKIEMVFEALLPSIYENVNGKSEEEILELYEKEKYRIKYCAGITSADEFVDFIKKALKVDCDFKEYSSVDYQVGSYQKNGDEETIKLVVNYKNGKSLTSIMYINSLSLDKIDARFEIE